MTHVHEYEKNPYESLWLNDYESHDVNRSLLEFEKVVNIEYTIRLCTL